MDNATAGAHAIGQLVGASSRLKFISPRVTYLVAVAVMVLAWVVVVARVVVVAQVAGIAPSCNGSVVIY